MENKIIPGGQAVYAEVKKQDEMCWGLESLARWAQRAQKEEGWPGRGREYEQGSPAKGVASASPEVAKSQFKPLKAQFTVVPGWD